MAATIKRMKQESIEQLIALNNEFYMQSAPSFSATRHNSWPGWERLVDCIWEYFAGSSTEATPPMTTGERKHAGPLQLAVLDLACGNMRFERYLEQKLPNFAFNFHTVDSCTEFAWENVESPLTFTQFDLIQSLSAAKQSEAAEALQGKTPCQLVVSFAFMHHIPSEKLRLRFLCQLLDAVAPGGLACVSLWRFAEEESMAAKAQDSTAEALRTLKSDDLEPGDYLLGWQNKAQSWRYCHSFTNQEIENLIHCANAQAQLLDRYESDGRNGRMNCYLIFQKRQ